MPVPLYRAPKDSQPWGLLGAIGRFISPPGYQARGPFAQAAANTASQQKPFSIGRSAAAAPRDIQTAEPEFPTEPGPGWMFQARAQQLRRNAPAAPVLPPPGAAPGFGSTPVVRGTRDGVTPDRTQSDLYRQYAPQPTFAANPLSQQYRAESEAGRKNMPEVVAGLTQGLEGEKAKAMQTWAQANPMLAYREYNKRFPAGEPTIGPTPAALQADEALKGVSGFFPGAEPSGFAPGVANAVPAPWNTQGALVDLNRGVQNIQPFQMAKTSGEAMPDFETTAAYSSDVSNRVSQFLKDKGAFNTFRG